MGWRIPAVVVAFFLFAEPAFASCGVHPPACQIWRDYAAVFDGTVRSIERVDRQVTIDGLTLTIGARLVTFDVHDAWSGPVGKEARLVLEGGYEDDGVPWHGMFHVTVGRRYLMFARWSPDGDLTAHRCGHSTLYEDAAGDLAFLRSLREPKSGGRIFGMLTMDDRINEPASRVDTTITLTGNGRTQTVASRNGRYEFTGLAGGEYSLAADPLPHSLGHQSRSVTLPGGASCELMNFYFRPATTISGTLLDNTGRPVTDVGVELAPAATWQTDRWKATHARSDADGRFEFRGVPPGAYIVALNLRDDVSYAPYPRRLFPDDDDPQVIQLAPGQRVDVGTWTVGPPLNVVTMRIRLVDAAGRPLPHGYARLFDVTRPDDPENPPRVGGEVADADGWVVYEGRSSRKYAIARSTEGPDEIPPLSTPFAAETATKGVTVVLHDKPGRRRR